MIKAYAEDKIPPVVAIASTNRLNEVLDQALDCFNGFGSILKTEPLRAIANELSPSEIAKIEREGFLEIGRRIEQGIALVCEKLRESNIPENVISRALDTCRMAARTILNDFLHDMGEGAALELYKGAVSQKHFLSCQTTISRRRAEIFLKSLETVGLDEHTPHQHRLKSLCREALRASSNLQHAQ